jgi:hypothetical protein
LLAPAKRAYFDYWEQRLKEELGPPDDRQALDLLNSVARNPAGEPLPSWCERSPGNAEK